jgi:hypothetical protein
MVESVDAEIRKAFHHLRLSSYHKCPNTIVIDELGLAHGKNRIDIAVVNGCIHGFEIKSSRDNLSRLPEQLAVYSKTLEKLSIISAPNHFDAVMQMSPDWCGLILVEKGIRGGIKFKTIRRADKNPSVDLIALSHLLWRKEAIELLKELGAGGKELNGSRLKLYTQLSELVSTKELTGRIKKQFMRRENWRVVQQPL